MPLVSMTDMLIKARQGGYAVGAFNILDYNSMKAVVEAAEELKSPVIVQTSEKTVLFWGYNTIISWIKELTVKNSVPVAIHLDHCKNLGIIRNCIDAGWSSVMIDASSLPLDENISITLEVIKMARPQGISVEAELGEIGGIEDDISIDEENAHLAGVVQARTFLSKVRVECFAPAIGTAHGLYKGEPKIAFDRLEEISRLSDVPLALHGGTGLSEDVFKRCIALGCSKINISTQLKYAFIDGFLDYHQSNPEDYNPLTVLKAQYNALKQAVVGNILLFGSNLKVK